MYRKPIKSPNYTTIRLLTTGLFTFCTRGTMVGSEIYGILTRFSRGFSELLSLSGIISTLGLLILPIRNTADHEYTENAPEKCFFDITNFTEGDKRRIYVKTM